LLEPALGHSRQYAPEAPRSRQLRGRIAFLKVQRKVALQSQLRGKVDFLLVSIDPDRDTLAALRAFRQQHGLAADWRILRGSPEDVKRLADLVGFSYYPGSQLQFAHSLLITELNPTGDIIFQQSGSGAPPREAVAALVRQARKWAK